MGCVSSTLLNRDEEFPQLGGSAAFSHHIVSLTSTTYGFLATLDHHPPLPSPPQAPPTKHQPLETINTWDLMSGLDSDHVPSFRHMVDKFEALCPPKGKNRVVLYTTSLRGVRKTFEDCEAVRSAIRGLGVAVCERDISMDRGFRDELRELMKGRGTAHLIPPRLFVDGRYVGGTEEVMRILEEGSITKLLQGLPLPPLYVAAPPCEGCGGVGFLPCCKCHGSCKMVSEVEFEVGGGVQGKRKKRRSVVVKCGDCNENGLVLCPICS